MIMILETAAQTVGVIVDAVDEVLTVKADQLEQLPNADTTLMDSIAKLGDRLVVLINPSTLFAATALSA
jgi:purine-binding chemotaxis protein CheW